MTLAEVQSYVAQLKASRIEPTKEQIARAAADISRAMTALPWFPAFKGYRTNSLSPAPSVSEQPISAPPGEPGIAASQSPKDQ